MAKFYRQGNFKNRPPEKLKNFMGTKVAFPKNSILGQPPSEFRENTEDYGLNSALYSLHDSNARRGHLRRLQRHVRQVIWIDDLNFSKPHEILSFLIQKGNREEVLDQTWPDEDWLVP
ncbi:hypothetical protein [Methylobacter svalbardensis]|uniref:hypothetical protein n=1 Tax=Methylobacter svalbardensis TaxID=3080016 RepID=UPI0030EC8D49